MRFRSLALLLLPLVATSLPAQAGTVFLKVKAEGGQPVKLTVKALSHGPMTLPAEPIVYVDEGQGFKARPDLRCRIANTDKALQLEADREFTGSCELPLAPSPRLRVRLGYKHGETLSTSNTVTLVVSGAATARIGQ
jgi:hypothetical protein